MRSGPVCTRAAMPCGAGGAAVGGSSNRHHHPSSGGSCQLQCLIAVHRLPSTSGIDGVATFDDDRRIVAAAIDRGDRQRDLLGRHRPEPVLEPTLFLGGEIRLDRPEQGEVLGFNRPRICCHKPPDRSLVVCSRRRRRRWRRGASPVGLVRLRRTRLAFGFRPGLAQWCLSGGGRGW